MANELRGVSTTGTLYAFIMDAEGKIWNGSSFEDYSAGNYSTYAVSMSEQGNSGVYVADFPSGITSRGIYDFYIRLQAGGSPSEGDPVVTTGRVNWGGAALSVGSAGAASGSEIRGVSNNQGTLYARVMNSAGRWWNGSSFEAYVAGNYSSYAVSMTEQGNSQVFTADFPIGITDTGTFEYYVHAQAGGSPAEGDPVVNTGKIDWTGSAAVQPSYGGMSGANFYAYILRRGFKRTDKETEVYEAMYDAIQELRQRFSFGEAEAEVTVSRLISTLGEYRMSLEADFGLLIGIVMEDDDTAVPLEHISKEEFDRRHPDINVTNDRGYPKEFCIFNGQILVGPMPDQTSYSYRISYSTRAGVITSDTASVPFTNLYRDMLTENILSRLYNDLEEFDRAALHEGKFEKMFSIATRRERINKGESSFMMDPVDC